MKNKIILGALILITGVVITSNFNLFKMKDFNDNVNKSDNVLNNNINQSNSNNNEHNNSAHQDDNKQDENEGSFNELYPVPEDVILSSSVELYKESVRRMKRCQYKVNGFGVSTNNKSSEPLYIYETLEHSKDEIYFEKISNGDKVMGIVGVSFAERGYINKDTGRRQSANTGNPWNSKNGAYSSDINKAKDNYPLVNNYSNPIDKKPDAIKQEFGMSKEGSYLNFNIDKDTINNPDEMYIKNNNGEYLLKFDLKIDNGIYSNSIAGYREQVNAMSGKELAKVNSIKINIVLDKYLRVKKIQSNEHYGVTTLNTEVKNNLLYEYTYIPYTENFKTQKF